MNTPAKGSRARFLTADDIADAAERLQACVDEIKGLSHAMKADGFNDLMKIDGGDMIADAVQRATAWFYKVQGVYRVKKVAASMMYRSAPPDPSGTVQLAPKKKAKKHTG